MKKAVGRSRHIFDLLMGIEDGAYSLRLFILKQEWNNAQLLTEARIFRNSLNNGGFNYPFKLVFVNATTMENEEYVLE